MSTYVIDTYMCIYMKMRDDSVVTQNECIDMPTYVNMNKLTPRGNPGYNRSSMSLDYVTVPRMKP